MVGSKLLLYAGRTRLVARHILYLNCTILNDCCTSVSFAQIKAVWLNWIIMFCFVDKIPYSKYWPKWWSFCDCSSLWYQEFLVDSIGRRRNSQLTWLYYSVHTKYRSVLSYKIIRFISRTLMAITFRIDVSFGIYDVLLTKILIGLLVANL